MTYDGYCRMKRRVRNVVAVLVLLVIAVGIVLFIHFVLPDVKSCEAVIYNSGYHRVNEDFLKENMTSTETRTFVLSNNEDCLDCIGSWEYEVDFDKEVLILYLFTDTHSREIPYWLTDVKVRNKVLRIGITLHPTPRAEDYIVSAWQRSILVRMEKVEFESVEFYEVTKNTNPKNAVLYNDARTIYGEESYFREEFLEENRTYGTYYYDEYNSAQWDTTSPDTRTHIVTNQEEYDEIFDDFIDVDFEKEILVVYAFTGSDLRNYRITNVELEGGNLQIEYICQDLPGCNDGIVGVQRYFVLKMDKTEFDTVEFIQIKRYYENIVKPFEE